MRIDINESKDYKISSQNIQAHSEETSAISVIIHDIENANDYHLNRDAIRARLYKRYFVFENNRRKPITLR